MLAALMTRSGVSAGILLEAAEHVGGHPVYNQVVLTELQELSPSLTPRQAAAELSRIAQSMRDAIAAGEFGPWA